MGAAAPVRAKAATIAALRVGRVMVGFLYETRPKWATCVADRCRNPSHRVTSGLLTYFSASLFPSSATATGQPGCQMRAARAQW
jgi:hypothetical protein